MGYTMSIGVGASIGICAVVVNVRCLGLGAAIINGIDLMLVGVSGWHRSVCIRWYTGLHAGTDSMESTLVVVLVINAVGRSLRAGTGLGLGIGSVRFNGLSSVTCSTLYGLTCLNIAVSGKGLNVINGLVCVV